MIIRVNSWPGSFEHLYCYPKFNKSLSPKEYMFPKDESKPASIETITPLPAATFNRNRGTTEARSRRRWIKILALLGSLTLLVIGGCWLLYYLSRNPLQTDKVAKDFPPLPAPVKWRPNPTRPLGNGLDSRSRSADAG